MAHYMAKNGSRFLFSHDTTYLAVYSIDKFLKNESMQMRFHTVDGNQVAANEAMSYYYRPTEMEHYCFYEHNSLTELISVAQAEKSEQETFPLLEDHPLHQVKVTVYRKYPSIPTFAWNWLGSTKMFVKPMTEIVESTNCDFTLKEEYAYKFMILFMPFRVHSDFMVDGSYQKGWLRALEMDMFSPEMKEIAQNIQTIHNSMESTIPSNGLTSGTILQDRDEFPVENGLDNDTGNDFLLSIGELFASTNSENCMTEDADNISPLINNKYNMMTASEEFDSGIEHLDHMESVVQFHEPEELYCQNKMSHNTAERYRTTVSELNSLFSKSVVMREEDSNDEHEINLKIIIDATGSCESIELWGKNQKLDTEQQTAFEIITACYILTFYNEANSNGRLKHDDIDYTKRLKDLHTLARRTQEERKKLRLFVTGPAGAGKCKIRLGIYFIILLPLTFCFHFFCKPKS